MTLGVDRILDMCRTSVNILGDVVACCTVERLTTSSADDTGHSVTEQQSS